MACETSGPEHTDQLCKALSRNYKEWNLAKEQESVDKAIQT